jgi:DNA repair exonuclease SbcCD ATPase subunit
MINFKTLTVKNFMSVGNATQGISFDRQDLTLVLGENLDLGGDGSRNGTGKTTIINALSYALYGQALTNIRRDNLVNKTNAKNMLVSLEFEIDGRQYRIERGRKPNVLRFFVNHEEQTTEQVEDDDAQGDSRETQKAIEHLLGMSHEMFKHILALNTYTLPFLSLKANEQRVLIEQLLGITLLSEKADKVKETAKITKDSIASEEIRIRAVQEANKRIEEQIESLKKRQTLWLNKQREDCEKLQGAITSLEHIDIETEIQSHRDLEVYYATKKSIDEHNRWIKSIDSDQIKLDKQKKQLEAEIAALDDHKCYACGQDIHDHKQDEIKTTKQASLQELAVQYLDNESQRDEHANELDDLGELGSAPTVFYDTLEHALNHRNSLDTLRKDLTARGLETDPYDEQIIEMQRQALQEITYDHLNDLTKLYDHQDFLLKLLTNKDSFIRKKIIDQNLAYLNNRLTFYLDRIGLPHQVAFLNDLTVEITELGRDLDFDNLSRGERNRLILSLSWAFRDVWENLYSPINLMFIDELVDSGMDTQGVENSMGLLKKMSRERHKSVWLISHRDELASRVENILRVVKENGFTSYSTEVDTV